MQLDKKGSVDELDKSKGSAEEVRMAKREEGGRVSVSHIDVSMNAPIRHQRPGIREKAFTDRLSSTFTDNLALCTAASLSLL